MNKDKTFSAYFHTLHGSKDFTPLHANTSSVTRKDTKQATAKTTHSLHNNEKKSDNATIDVDTHKISKNNKNPTLTSQDYFYVCLPPIVSPSEKLHWYQHGNQKTATLLKRGKFSPEQSIDLHGYTLYDAMEKISQIFCCCIYNNMRTIHIIHGKGSDAQPSIIKAHLYYLLPKHPNVLACVSCTPQTGGTGAIIVRLKNTHKLSC